MLCFSNVSALQIRSDVILQTRPEFLAKFVVVSVLRSRINVIIVTWTLVLFAAVVNCCSQITFSWHVEGIWYVIKNRIICTGYDHQLWVCIKQTCLSDFCSIFIVIQEAQNWMPLSFEKVKNDLVWRGVEVVILCFDVKLFVQLSNLHDFLLHLQSGLMLSLL